MATNVGNPAFVEVMSAQEDIVGTMKMAYSRLATASATTGELVDVPERMMGSLVKLGLVGQWWPTASSMNPCTSR